MAMLGDLLASARDSAAGFTAWLAAADPELAQEVEDAARRSGLPPSAWARMAVADFSRFAAEEDWASLASRLRDADDPGLHCLDAMVRWRLTAPGCSAHSSSPVEGAEP